MSRRSEVVFWLLMALLASSTPSMGLDASKAPSPIGLADAKKYAVENNAQVLSLRREVEEARAAVSRLSAPFYPVLGVAGGVDSDIAPNEKKTVAVGYAYLNYTAFSGFADVSRRRAAALEVEKAEIKLRRAEFRVGLDVERQFNLHHFKKLAVDLKKEALKTNENHKRAARQKKSAGLASDADLMEFDMREAILLSDIASLEQDILESRVNLKLLLGESLGTAIDPAGSFEHIHLKGSLDDFMALAKKENEAVLVAGREVSQAEAEAKVAGARWFPSVELTGQYGYLDLLYRPKDDSASFRGGALLKFDLFQGFSVVSGQREAQAKRLKAEALLTQQTLSAVAQTEITYRKARATESRVHLEEKNRDRAKLYYEAILSEYKRGMKNSVDMRVGADTLVDATLRAETFKYELIVQKLELERILGVPVTTEVVAGSEGHFAPADR